MANISLKTPKSGSAPKSNVFVDSEVPLQKCYSNFEVICNILIIIALVNVKSKVAHLI